MPKKDYGSHLPCWLLFSEFKIQILLSSTNVSLQNSWGSILVFFNTYDKRRLKCGSNFKSSLLLRTLAGTKINVNNFLNSFKVIKIL